MIILLVILIAVSFLIVVLSMDGRADMPAADIKPVEELPLVLADGKPRCAENVSYTIPHSLNFISKIRNLRPNAIVNLTFNDLGLVMKTNGDGDLYFNRSKDPFPLYAIPFVEMRLNFDTKYCSTGETFQTPIAVVGSGQKITTPSFDYTITSHIVVPRVNCAWFSPEDKCAALSGQCTWTGDKCAPRSTELFPPTDIAMKIAGGAIGVSDCGLRQGQLATCQVRLLADLNIISSTVPTCETVAQDLAQCKAKRMSALKRI
jgi:hypothetical protein